MLKYDRDEDRQIFLDDTWEPWAGGFVDFARIFEILATGALI